MALETKLYTVLTGATAVTANIGTRIYPAIAPEKASVPHLIYNRITGGQMNGLDGYLTVENPLIQIDIHSTSYSQAKTIAEDVHTAIGASTTFKAILTSDRDLYEDELKYYRVSMDFSFINKE